MPDDREWAQRLLAGTPGTELPQPPRPAPRRVLDGALAETLGRPVWCLCAPGLRAAGALDPLVALLRDNGRRVVLLDPGGDTGTARGVGEVCRRLRVTAAEVVQVEAAGAPAPPAEGARRLLLGGAGQRRGAVAVAGVPALARLFRGEGRYVSGSTYHEV